MKNISNIPGLYLHIPFCDTKCGYCDFYSITNNSLRTTFLPAILKEIDHYKTAPFTHVEYDTIYLGGGTPSLLTPGEMDQIFSALYKNYSIAKDCEITVEVNPGTIDQEKLAFYKSIGINRLSIGIQSFNNDELKVLGRIHDSNQAIKTYERARKAAIENISIDLIYALPNQKIETWLTTLETALLLRPDHVSAYNLIFEEGTPFYKKLLQGRLSKKNAEEETDFYLHTINILEESGYHPYEVSSYAKLEERYSRHNYKYWNHTNFLSFGPSAHSYWNKKRWSNVRSLSKYISNINQGISVVDFSEYLEEETLIFENIMLSLRTYAGIDLMNFEKTYNESFLKKHNGLNIDLIKNGFAYIEEGNFKLTRKGMLICDEILSSFAPN